MTHFDNLWATISDTHARWDEGEIDNATAKAQCDTAIRDYLGMPSVEEIEALFPVQEEGSPTSVARIDQLVKSKATVTVEVPVEAAVNLIAEVLESDGDAHVYAAMDIQGLVHEAMEKQHCVDEYDMKDYFNRDDSGTGNCPDCDGEGQPLPDGADYEEYSRCGNCKGWVDGGAA